MTSGMETFLTVPEILRDKKLSNVWISN
jgi:hypothetical protein